MDFRVWCTMKEATSKPITKPIPATTPKNLTIVPPSSFLSLLSNEETYQFESDGKNLYQILMLPTLEIVGAIHASFNDTTVALQNINLHSDLDKDNCLAHFVNFLSENGVVLTITVSDEVLDEMNPCRYEW